MIVRIWKSAFDPAAKNRLAQYANDTSLPILSSREGCLGVLFLVSENEWITQTFWRDMDAIDALDTDPEYGRIVEGIRALNVLVDEQQVALYTFDGGRARID